MRANAGRERYANGLVAGAGVPGADRLALSQEVAANAGQALCHAKPFGPVVCGAAGSGSHPCRLAWRLNAWNPHIRSPWLRTHGAAPATAREAERRERFPARPHPLRGGAYNLYGHNCQHNSAKLSILHIPHP